MKVAKNVMSTSQRNDVLDAVAYLIAKSHGFDVSESATAWAVSVVEKFVWQFDRQKELGFETEV